MTSPTAPQVPDDPFAPRDYQLNWTRDDFEQRLMFRGGRFTSVNKLLTFLLGLILTAGFFGLMVLLAHQFPETRAFTDRFLERGWFQYASMLLFFWALAILFIKWRKLRFQRRALELAVFPAQADFVLTAETAQAVLDRMHLLADATGHFLLLNRIERGLSNLRNLGQVSDVSSILQAQASNDEEQLGSSYSLLHGFIWAIPVIGFIGTVVGLGDAIGAFGRTLQAGADMEAIRTSLEGVTAGLSTAFDTTFVALVDALILQLLITFLQTQETEFLDQCNDYCQANMVSRLRLRRPSED